MLILDREFLHTPEGIKLYACIYYGAYSQKLYYRRLEMSLKYPDENATIQDYERYYSSFWGYELEELEGDLERMIPKALKNSKARISAERKLAAIKNVLNKKRKE